MASNFLHHLLNNLPEESRWVMYENMSYYPQAKIYDLLLQLEQDVLRKVLLKKGKDSDEYAFFLKLTQVLYQAGEAANLVESLKEELNGMREYNRFLHERNAKLETEITRWRTIEELVGDDMLETYVKRTREILMNERTKPTDGNR